MTKKLYLGYSEYLPRPHTKIRCEAIATEGRWIKKNLETDLPPRGSAFSINLSWVSNRQPVAITTIPNQNTTNERYDQFLVDEACPIRQLVDFRRYSLEQIRYSLIEKGLSDRIQSANIIAVLSQTTCAIFELAHHINNDRLVASPGKFKVYEFDSRIFDGDSFDGLFFEIPGQTVGAEIDEILWELDQDILNSILRDLKELDLNAPTKKERERILSLLGKAQIYANSDQKWASRQEWLDSYISRMKDILEIPEEIVETLSTLDSVKENLKEATYSQLEPVVREQIHTEMSDMHTQLATMHAEFEHTKCALLQTEKQHMDLLDSTTLLKEQVFEEVQTLNQTLGEVANQESTDFIDLVERLREAFIAAGDIIKPIDPCVPPWQRSISAKNTEEIDLNTLLEALTRKAGLIGVREDDMKLFDLSIRSGSLVVIPQIFAEIMVTSYADLVSGGAFIREALGPNILNLDDMWRHPVRGVLSGFAQAWNRALKEPSRYQIVWLDGLERTAMDMWLPSLLGVLHSEFRPKNFLVVASLDENLLDSNRKWPALVNSCIPIYPSYEKVRLKKILDETQGIFIKKYLLKINKSSIELDDIDFDDHLKINNKNIPIEIKIEANIFYTQSLFNFKNNISQQLSYFRIARNYGQDWLKKILQ